MKERVRIVVVLAAVAAVFGGGAYYFFGVYQPAQVRGKAQAEVEAWGGRWKAARGCLLGPTPGSSKAGEALAIRELSPDPWSRGTCTSLVSKLSRGEAEDTGLPVVETAWLEIDRAAGGVATAFVAHIDPGGERSENRNVDPLPAALDELDRVYASLREVAGLDPPPASAAPALKPATLVPITDGGEPVTTLEAWSMPSVNRIVAFGRTAKREVQLALAPGEAPAVQPVAVGVLRALPESGWGAGGLPGGLAVGTLDASGAVTEPRALAKLDGQVSVYAVVGTATDGLVVAGTREQLVLARPTAAGKLAADKPLAIEQLAFALDPAGRALIAYNDGDGKLRAFVATSGKPVTAMPLGDGTASTACLTATRAWVAAGSEFVSFDPADPSKTIPHVMPDHELLGCTDQDALLHKRGAAHYTVCRETCRIAQLAQMRPSSVGTIAGVHVIGVATRGTVLGIWRENGPPMYFALPKKLAPTLAISNGTTIDIVGTSDGALVIARIP